MPKRNPIPIILALALTLVFLASGCGGSSASVYNDIGSGDTTAGDNTSAYYGDAAGGEAIQGDSDIAVESSGGVDAAQVSSAIDSSRIVLKRAAMTVGSWHPESLIDSVTGIATSLGGYVVTSNLRQRQGTYGIEIPEASITIRVPADKLDQAIETIKSLADTVVYLNQTGDDVTKEYTDLQSRLRNLEAASAQLNAIMANATDTEDVLDVYQELVDVNDQAEQIRGQIQYYEQAAALSSIEVTIIQIANPTPTPTIVPTFTPTPTATPRPTGTPEPWLPGETFKEAGKDLTVNFHHWIDGVIQFLVYFVPAFIFNVGPWLLAGYFIGRWVYRKWLKSIKPEEEEN